MEIVGPFTLDCCPCDLGVLLRGPMERASLNGITVAHPRPLWSTRVAGRETDCIPLPVPDLDPHQKGTGRAATSSQPQPRGGGLLNSDSITDYNTINPLSCHGGQTINFVTGFPFFTQSF
ncbi:hypothetical protein HNY73_013701 [Argiope bruennichi]|uniref:Uncharacterized protein n=1 Tax=Argiope bruennichi TaxID=94029 RepID=A0A8T0ESX6_ARGBR|nr:hypothetical protein HNY73_013701 [Argiope bruennichi]